MEIDLDNANKPSLPDRASPGKTANESIGRELDALIAERVMGWVWLNHNGTSMLVPRHLPNRTDFYWMPTYIGTEPTGTIRRLTGLEFRAGISLPHYSTDIAAATEVVEKMRERGYGWTFGTHRDGWLVRCFELPDAGLNWRHSLVVDKSMCVAICQTALAALEESQIADEKCGGRAITKAETKESV